MAINDPLITRKRAILISAFTWMIWMGIGALGFLFPNVEHGEWTDDIGVKCIRFNQLHIPAYTATVFVLRGLLIIMIIAMYFSTSTLLNKSINNNRLHNDNRTISNTNPNIESGAIDNQQQREHTGVLSTNIGDHCIINQRQLFHSNQAKYLDDRSQVLKILAIKAWMMIICWGLIVVVGLINTLCAPCREGFPSQVNYLLQVCHILPIMSNGGIYLAFNKDFRAACHRFLCMCCWKA
jgi:hypothetical protein